MLQKREKGQCLRCSDPVQLQNLLPGSCLLLYQRPQLSPKLMFQKADPQSLENAPVHKSTPWPGMGRMSDNLFEDRNWLLPPSYLDNENKYENKNMTSITSPRPPIKEEEPKVNEQSAEKCGWEPDCPFCKNQEKEKEENKTQQQKTPPQPKVQKPQA